jgi:transcription elongation GreA/GreB family factor
MNKTQLINNLLETLETNLQTALDGAKRAHSTATDKANIAENKYDTFSLEAAYLAEGYANRSAEYKENIEQVKSLVARDFSDEDAIAVGALVKLIDENEKSLWVFIAPVSGGIKFDFEKRSILVITQLSPLGQQVMHKYVDDELEIVVDRKVKRYYVAEIA